MGIGLLSRAAPTCPQRSVPEAAGNVVVPAEVVSIREEEQPQSEQLEAITVVTVTRGGHHVATAAQHQALQFRTRGQNHVDVHLFDDL